MLRRLKYADQMNSLPITTRTRIRRKPDRQITDRGALHSLLDDNLVAHVSFIRDGLPVIIPVAFGYEADTLYVHGSTGAGIFLGASGGLAVAVSITQLDGLVYASSTFDSSMNYRSAVILGTATPVADHDKERALRIITEHLMPGRWDEVRPLTPKELAATAVCRFRSTKSASRCAHRVSPRDRVKIPTYGRVSCPCSLAQVSRSDPNLSEHTYPSPHR